MSHTFCTIIPPYVLEEVARRADGHVAERARATLARDAQLRSVRAHAPTAAPHPTVAAARKTPRLDKPQRTIFDAKHLEKLPGTKVRSEGDPATRDIAVTEAYDGLGSTWQLYYDAYQRSSLDGKGLPLLGSVHYGRDYDNAFWDGTQMVFGDGDGVLFNRFTISIDVIGHELTHGVTEHTAGLRYQGASGALNESMSDVFGSLVKQYAKGQSAQEADWLIGEGLLAAGVKGVALRSMKAPGTAYDDPRLGKDPQPDHMSGYVDTTDDNGGVHINSGIPNRAFYLAAVAIGGKAWEGAGLYWYDALTGDGIHADCDFPTFAALTVAAAQARDGEDAAAKVSQAWAEVGVTPQKAPAKKPTRRRTPGATTRVEVVRSGGVAGMSRSTTVNLAELPRQEAMAWSSLLDGRLESLAQELAAAPETQARPDAFSYRVRYGTMDVTLPEQHLPEDVRALVRRQLG